MARKEIEAGRAFVTAGIKDQFTRPLLALEKRFKKVGRSVTQFGLRIANAFTGALKHAFAATERFGSFGDQVDKLSKRSGVSAEALSQLGFAAEQSGGTLEDMENVLRRMARSVRNFSQGLSTDVRAFNDLGIAYRDLAQLTPEEQFTLIADRISRVADPTQKAAIAMQVLGRGAHRILPLINEGAAGIQALREEADRLGLTLTQDQAAAAAEYVDAWNRVKRALGAVVINLGSGLATVLTDILNRLAPIVASTSKWVKENGRLVGIVTALLAVGATLGATLAALGVGITAVGFLFGALTSPLVLITAALGAAGVAFVTLTDAGQATVDVLSKGFAGLAGTFQRTTAAMGAALAEGDLAKAGEVLWASLKLLWLQGTADLQRKWSKFINGLLNLWAEATTGIAILGVEGFGRIRQTWDDVTAGLAIAWTLFTNEFMRAWAHTAAFFEKIWIRLKGLFDSGFDADAALGDIDKALAERDAQLTSSTVSKGIEVGRERGERRKQIDAETRAIVDELAAGLVREQGTLDAQLQDEIAAQQRALEDARAAWQASVESAEKIDAATKAQAASTAAGIEVGSISRNLTRGTFNALAAGALGRGGPQERMAQGIDRVAQNTGELVRRARKQQTGLAVT